MKLLKNKWLTIVLCAILLGALFFFYWRSVYKIDVDQVVSISFDMPMHGLNLNTEDTARFIDLFNSAEYAGKATGDGGTPEYSLCVHFKDGSFMWVNQFEGIGGDFVVIVRHGWLQKAWYYLNSKELEAFALELLDKYRN